MDKRTELEAKTEENIDSLLDAVYIAAFFDAEGSVSLYPVRFKGGKLGFAVNLLLDITNNSKEILEWIQSVLGGEIYKVSRRGQGFRRKHTYKLRWSNFKDILVVIDFLDFGGTRIKTEHLGIMRQYIVSRLSVTESWQNAPYTKEELYLVKKVMDLNRRTDKVYVGDTLLEEALRNGFKD